MIVNPRSGVGHSFPAMRRAIEKHWDVQGADVIYQFCRDGSDGMEKAARAADRGVELVLVGGGDGTVSTVGRALIGRESVLGVIPTGSGNGFARHFGIPLSPERACAALAGGTVRRIDVGTANDRPFLVTCSMAWDAAVVRSFEKYPVRGVLPYILAGVEEFIGHKPQDMEVTLDGSDRFLVEDPLVLTAANLTQYGGGATIAPTAQPDDGCLELVIARRKDLGLLLANIVSAFDGTIDKNPAITTRKFSKMVVHRPKGGPVQVDGELINVSGDVEVSVRPGALRVLIPRS